MGVQVFSPPPSSPYVSSPSGEGDAHSRQDLFVRAIRTPFSLLVPPPPHAPRGVEELATRRRADNGGAPRIAVDVHAGGARRAPCPDGHNELGAGGELDEAGRVAPSSSATARHVSRELVTATAAAADALDEVVAGGRDAEAGVRGGEFGVRRAPEEGGRGGRRRQRRRRRGRGRRGRRGRRRARGPDGGA